MVLPWTESPPGDENTPVAEEEFQIKITGRISPPTYRRLLDFKTIDTRDLKYETRRHRNTLPPIHGAKSHNEVFREYDEYCEERIMIQYDDGQNAGPRFGIDTEPERGIPDTRIAHNLGAFNIRTLNALQRKTIPLMRDGYGLLVQAPTGIGKTYAFLIPAVERALEERRMRKPKSEKSSPYVLIMSSTGRLVNQLHSRCELILGTVSHENVQEIREIKIDRLVSDWSFRGGQCDIAFATMGKLEATIKEGGICLDNLKMIILDEADKMVDESAFGVQVGWVFDQLKEEVKANVQCCFFSATYSEYGGVISLSPLQERLMGDRKYAVLVCPRKPGCITQRVIQVPRYVQNFSSHPWIFKMSKISALIDEDLEENGCPKEGPFFKQTMVIFCETVGRVNQVAMALRLAGYNFRPVSRMVGKAQQEVTLNDLAHGKIHGVVCTNLMARGIDIPSIRHTIVMEMSMDFDTYKHRIGRVGRDGEGGKSTVFVDEGNMNGREAMNIEALVDFMNEMQQTVPEFLNKWYMERHQAYQALYDTTTEVG